MKICPQCQTSYTDDSLQFCLQDGTPLAAAAATAAGNDWDGPETVISPTPQESARIDLQNSRSQKNWTRIPEMNVVEAPKRSNTALTVVLTALLTLLAAGAIIGGIYYTRNKNTEVAQNTNSKPVNNTAPNVSKTNKTSSVNSNTNSAVANSADGNSAEVNSATPAPSATPAKPALNSKGVKMAEADIRNAIGDWKDSTENFDLDANLANYADTVDYYRAGKVDAGTVRADKQNAFGSFSNIDIDISNMKITLDETGENAAVLFDKEWNFEGEGKSSSGKVQQQLQFAKIDGKWRITGERDLRVYYTR